METYLIKDQTLTAIADKIREKSSSAIEYKIADEYLESEIELVEDALKIAYIEYIDMGDEYSDPLMEENDDAFINDDKYMWYGYWENNRGEVVPVLFKTDIYGDEPDDPDYADPHYYVGTEEIYDTVYDKWRKIDGALTWEDPRQKYILTNQIVQAVEKKYTASEMGEAIYDLLLQQDNLTGHEIVCTAGMPGLGIGNFIEFVNSFGTGVVSSEASNTFFHACKLNDHSVIVASKHGSAVGFTLMQFNNETITTKFTYTLQSNVSAIKIVPIREDLILVLRHSSSTTPSGSIYKIQNNDTDFELQIISALPAVSGRSKIVDVIPIDKYRLLEIYSVGSTTYAVIVTIQDNGTCLAGTAVTLGSNVHTVSALKYDKSRIIVAYSTSSGASIKLLSISENTISTSSTLSLNANAKGWINITKFTNNKFLISYAENNRSLMKMLYVYGGSRSTAPTVTIGSKLYGLAINSTTDGIISQGSAIQLDNNKILLLTKYTNGSVVRRLIRSEGETVSTTTVTVGTIGPCDTVLLNMGQRGILALDNSSSAVRYSSYNFNTDTNQFAQCYHGGLLADMAGSRPFGGVCATRDPEEGSSMKVIYQPRQFDFAIKTTYLKAYNQMTWFEWCQSGFNTEHYQCLSENDTIATANGYYKLISKETGMYIHGSDIVENIPYDLAAQEITFRYSNNSVLTAKYGMTWYEWIKSSYDMEGWNFNCGSPSAQVYQGIDSYKVGLNGDFVYGNHIITPGARYDRTIGTTQTFTIKYNANGGTGTMFNTSISKAGSSTDVREIKLSACTFTAPAGKQFIGWSTNANGTGTKYPPESRVFMTPGTLTLYAQYAEMVSLKIWKSRDISYMATWLGSQKDTGPMSCLSATATLPTNLQGYYNSPTHEVDFTPFVYGANGASENTTIALTVTVPKGTTLTVYLKNQYYNYKQKQCEALLNGVSQKMGTDISYTYTLNSDAEARFHWRVEGLLGGQTALTCDSWWDCYMTM